VREDYDFQAAEFPNVDLPVNILDNDFRNPDIDRYLQGFEKYDPSVAILGDAYNKSEAEELNEYVEQLREQYPFKEYVAVPKCQEALEILDDTTLGYAMGYSDIQASDFSEPRDWRGLDLHLLGASPPKQYEVIQTLTQPTLENEPSANIKGLDWNGVHRGACVGEYWSREGWKPADHLSIRETVRKSLEEIKAYWQSKGVWPDTEPIDIYGPAVEESDDNIFIDLGGDPIPDREALEEAYVEEYSTNGEDVVWAFQNQKAKEFIEHREGL